MTPEQVIEKFGARESEFKKARENYTFRQTVKVDTISEDTNRVDGEYQQVTDITFNNDGKREEHVVFAPQNTLERVLMTPADFDEIEHRLPFILTTEDLPKYDVVYLGRQHVDELDTYVFSAGPKVLEKGKHYFQGKVWVDQQDFQIVLINGKTVPQDTRRGHEDLQPPFTTYYEQVDGKYWFPTYTKAEGNLHFAAQSGALSQDVHMRNVVKYSDYKQFHATSRIIYNGQDITNNKAPDDKDKDTNKPPPAKRRSSNSLSSADLPVVRHVLDRSLRTWVPSESAEGAAYTSLGQRPRNLVCLAVRVRIGVLLRHPAVHQRARTPRSAQVLHPRRMCVVTLPSRQFNQRLVLLGLLSLEAVHPSQPPVPTLALFVPAHVTLITLDVSHSRSPAGKISHLCSRLCVAH